MMTAALGVLLRRLGATVVLLLLAGLLFPGTANAGGPTSALLVSPGHQRAAAVYYSDAAYQELTTLLDDDPSASAAPAELASVGQPRPSPGTDYVTVTWLIHDVTVWRIDRIFLPVRPGGDVFVVTQTELGDPAAAQQSAGGMGPGEQGDDNARWHRSVEPARLTGLLTDLGLLGSGHPTAAPDAGLSSVLDPAAVDQAAVDQAAVDQAAVDQDVVDQAAVGTASVDTAATDKAAGAGAGWWWAVGGLLAGAGLMVVALRCLPAAQRRFLAGGTTAGSGDDRRWMVENPG